MILLFLFLFVRFFRLIIMETSFQFTSNPHLLISSGNVCYQPSKFYKHHMLYNVLLFYYNSTFLTLLYFILETLYWFHLTVVFPMVFVSLLPHPKHVCHKNDQIPVLILFPECFSVTPYSCNRDIC